MDGAIISFIIVAIIFVIGYFGFRLDTKDAKKFGDDSAGRPSDSESIVSGGIGGAGPGGGGDGGDGGGGAA